MVCRLYALCAASRHSLPTVCTFGTLYTPNNNIQKIRVQQQVGFLRWRACGRPLHDKLGGSAFHGTYCILLDFRGFGGGFVNFDTLGALMVCTQPISPWLPVYAVYMQTPYIDKVFVYVYTYTCVYTYTSPSWILSLRVYDMPTVSTFSRPCLLVVHSVYKLPTAGPLGRGKCCCYHVF